MQIYEWRAVLVCLDVFIILGGRTNDMRVAGYMLEADKSTSCFGTT